MAIEDARASRHSRCDHILSALCTAHVSISSHFVDRAFRCLCAAMREVRASGSLCPVLIRRLALESNELNSVTSSFQSGARETGRTYQRSESRDLSSVTDSPRHMAQIRLRFHLETLLFIKCLLEHHRSLGLLLVLGVCPTVPDKECDRTEKSAVLDLSPYVDAIDSSVRHRPFPLSPSWNYP